MHGKVIAQFRKAKGLTQTQIAEKSGINYRHYQNIEAERVDVKVSTVRSVAKTLGLPTCFLLQDRISKDLLHAEVFCPVQIFDCLPVGIVVFNSEGKIEFANPYFRKHLTNHSRKELVEELYVWDLLHGDSEVREMAKQKFQYVKTAKPSPSPARWTYSGPNGKPLDVLVIWDYLYNRRGDVSHYVSTIFPAPTPNSI